MMPMSVAIAAIISNHQYQARPAKVPWFSSLSTVRACATVSTPSTSVEPVCDDSSPLLSPSTCGSFPGPVMVGVEAPCVCVGLSVPSTSSEVPPCCSGVSGSVVSPRTAGSVTVTSKLSTVLALPRPSRAETVTVYTPALSADVS